MSITGLEAMADAGMHVEGWYPGSRSYRNRNPGNLRASPVAHEMDPEGYCIFPSFLDGYIALLGEYRMKATGQNEHHIGPGSTLNELYDVYAPRADMNDPNRYADQVAQWLTVALKRPVTHNSTLRYVCAELFGG
jgi:hypothetical protein